VFRRQIGQSTISGIYVRHPVAGHCVLVNYSEDVFRQRFSAAHEVAHAILDYDKDVIVSFTRWDRQDLSEVRANTFASQFLMPPEFLTRIPDARQWDDRKILEYARNLMVNPEALTYALRDAGLITDADVSAYKVLRIPQDEKSDPELPVELSEKSRARKAAMLQKGLSDDYVALCIKAYEEAVVTRGRLSEMLLVDETGLDGLCDLYGRKLDHGH